MNYYTTMRGGIGDLLIYMMRPGSDLGYFADLKSRGHKTMVEVIANHAFSRDLFTNMPNVDYVKFNGFGVANGESFQRLRFNHERALEWRPPQIALDADEQRIFDKITAEPYVAVHFFASGADRILPAWGKLLVELRKTGVRTVLLGSETQDDLPPKLRLHVAVAQRATKFIGSQSCFNCAAQLARVPSFVIVNRSKSDQSIYNLMHQNHARIEAWNVGKPLDRIYREAAAWAADKMLLS